MKDYRFLLENDSNNIYFSKLANEIAEQTEKAIVSQLNDFISRGLIELEVSEPILVQDCDKSGIQYKRSVLLKLKDREYVEKLEKKVELLENLVKQLKEIK